MTRFAEGTAVAPERSRAEIERLVRARGSKSFHSGSDHTKSAIGFELDGRRILFEMPAPKPDDYAHVMRRGRKVRATPEQQQRAMLQAERSAWRALLLTIKAKLVSVDSRIETIEEAFLAQMVVPTDDGRAARFYEVVRQSLTASLRSGRPMLMANNPEGQ